MAEWQQISTAPRGPLIEARRVVNDEVLWQGEARWSIWRGTPEFPACQPAWLTPCGQFKVPVPTEWRPRTVPKAA